MAWDAPPIPSPAAKWVLIATSIVINNNIEKYLIYNPNKIIIPPTNSENAAIKPQNVGKKCIPIDPIPYEPKPAHFSKS